MIKALILYYLSIKSTHGYEIQRFIQLNEMDQWTKIQSGSIYYALSKLEKEGLIDLQAEIGTGPKARKIYEINEKGREALKAMAEEELSKALYPVGSDKFILYPFLNTLDKETIRRVVEAHLKELREQRAYQTKWQAIKINENSLAIERLSFEMMLSSLEYQIRWHETLLNELDQTVDVSGLLEDLVRTMDFSKS